MTYVASSMKSFLVPAGVLDPPLFEIERNNETKMKLKWDNTFQKQPSRRVFQVCVLQISNLLKPLEYMFEGKGAQIAPDRYISRIFIAVVKTVTHITEFLWNTSWLLLAFFEITVARAVKGYQGLLLKVRARVRFFSKRVKKCLRRAKYSKIWPKICKTWKYFEKMQIFMR